MAEGGHVISCHSLEQWSLNLDKANESQKLIVVDFTASWCGPCKVIAPILDEFAKDHPHVMFLKVDVDEMTDLAEGFGIQAMPTFIFMKDGNQIAQVQGAKKDELLAAIKTHSEGTAPTSSSATPAEPATSANL